MVVRRYLYYWDWLVLMAVAAGCYWLNERTEQQFDMVTTYNPGWVFGVSFLGPLVATVYFSWKYQLFDRSTFIGSGPVVFFLVSVVWLADALPRFVLLATVPPVASPASLQNLDVAYVNQHYAKTTYIGSTIGIHYGGEVLRFESSRINYFLLKYERCIRAEIGRAAPGFYYIRHLQHQPGARERARSAYWSYWWHGAGRWAIGGTTFGLLAWLLSLFLRKRRKIHL